MNTMMMDRTRMQMPNAGMPAMAPMSGMATAMPAGPNYVMVPRCTMRFEKCAGGMKIHCVCDDDVATGMMQNLCSMMQNSLCTCCCMMNGMMVCCCSLTMGMWQCDANDDGCTLTCTSGDPKCCDMIQSCCDCLQTMCASGCTCCLMMNNTPVCCGMAPRTPAKRR